MIRVFDFGIKLLNIYRKAEFSQIQIKHSDHNKPYLGKKSPLSVTFCCTHKCNLRCLHCSAWKGINEKEKLSTQRFVSLIDELKSLGTVKIGLTGGEPLIRNDIGTILRKLYEKKFIVHLTSNSWFVPKYINELEKLDLLVLSLDGNKTVHDSIRGQGSHNKFIEAVTIAKEKRIPLAAMLTLNSLNLPVLKDVTDTTSALKMLLMVGFLNDFESVQTEKMISKYQVKEAMKILLKKKNLATSKRYYEFIQGNERMSKCFAGIGHFFIGADSVLYPCSIAYQDKKNYQGISLLENSLEEAINELPLYRKKCDSCKLICYHEMNLIYQLNVKAIFQNLRIVKY